MPFLSGCSSNPPSKPPEPKPKPPPPKSKPADSSCPTGSCPPKDPCDPKRTGPEDEALIKCLQQLCKDDPQVLSDARGKVKVFARDPKKVDIMEYDGSSWNVSKTVTSGGTAVENADGTRTIWINRGGDCTRTKGTMFHEVLHTKQPSSMTSRDKEIEAHTKTEQWLIDRGFPGSDKKRKKDKDGNFIKGADGKPQVDEEAIKRLVDKLYGYKKGKPRIIGTRDGGKTVVLEDRTTRPAAKGDKRQRKTPGQTLCETPIDPSRLTCP